MRVHFVLAAITAFSLTDTASAAEPDIYAALNKVTASTDGAGIAQGLAEVGQNLINMNTDETIAFRTSLSILLASGQVPEDTAERDMVNVLEQATTRHLLSLCSVDRSPETVIKVNTELGYPYPCTAD